jgi:hypothetical protein
MLRTSRGISASADTTTITAAPAFGGEKRRGGQQEAGTA